MLSSQVKFSADRQTDGTALKHNPPPPPPNQYGGIKILDRRHVKC